jgi:hypothetical protein
MVKLNVHTKTLNTKERFASSKMVKDFSVLVVIEYFLIKQVHFLKILKSLLKSGSWLCIFTLHIKKE